MRAVRVGIVGDFDRAKRSHWATEAALFHAAARVGVSMEPRWIPTSSLAERGAGAQLSGLDGIWGAPGSPYLSMQGALNAIRHARENDVAYLGTCAGFQYALVELTRNVLGISDADTAENDPEGQNVVITPVECAVPMGERAHPALSGLGVAWPVAGSSFERLCGGTALQEEYFCNFETNRGFIARWEGAGLRVGARGGSGEMRAFELPARRFFLATLFQPQLTSCFERPHPIIEGYVRACAGAARSR